MGKTSANYQTGWSCQPRWHKHAHQLGVSSQTGFVQKWKHQQKEVAPERYESSNYIIKLLDLNRINLDNLKLQGFVDSRQKFAGRLVF